MQWYEALAKHLGVLEANFAKRTALVPPPVIGWEHRACRKHGPRTSARMDSEPRNWGTVNRPNYSTPCNWASARCIPVAATEF